MNNLEEKGVVPTDLSAISVATRTWLLSAATPLWSVRGRTECGLFAERMTMSGEPDAAYFRSFVQARHIFAFVVAGRMGWDGPWAVLVGQTIEFLLARARRSDGFFVHRLDKNGNTLDCRADLYDQAFILLAFAVAGGALEREDLFDAAEYLLDALEREWTHPAGGFREGEIVEANIRRQNPHMHLLEALSALAEESGRQRFWDAALKIAGLCQQHFVDPETGALLEYFTEDWRPAGENGRVVEPGHCCEWAWLFERLYARGWEGGVQLSDQLVHFARAHGLDDSRGVMMDEVWIDGAPRSLRARLWPQTERIKVAVARWARLREPAEAAEAANAVRGLARYLSVDLRGLWYDKLNADGTWVNEHAPGSSLYHISCACAELDNAARG